MREMRCMRCFIIIGYLNYDASYKKKGRDQSVSPSALFKDVLSPHGLDSYYIGRSSTHNPIAAAILYSIATLGTVFPLSIREI